MGLIVFPIGNVIAPLLLFFDVNGGGDRHAIDVVGHHRSGSVAPPSPSTLNVADNYIRAPVTAAAELHRSQGVNFNAVPSSISAPSGTGGSWNLPNGNVQFDRPLTFAGIRLQDDGRLKSDSSSSISLWDPKFLGSGGSGAVFSFSTHQRNNNLPNSLSTTGPKSDEDDDEKVAIKVSWKRSTASVINECSILRSLENVPHVERCLGKPVPYPYDEEGRVMIALSPVVQSTSTSSLRNVIQGMPQRHAVKSIVETMVGMLRCGIYTIDVQPLISVETGDVVFIDFTEARHFSLDDVAPTDESALVGFSSEMIALVPDSLRDLAVDYLKIELANDASTPLPEKVVEILESMWID